MGHGATAPGVEFQSGLFAEGRGRLLQLRDCAPIRSIRRMNSWPISAWPRRGRYYRRDIGCLTARWRQGVLIEPSRPHVIRRACSGPRRPPPGLIDTPARSAGDSSSARNQPGSAERADDQRSSRSAQELEVDETGALLCSLTRCRTRWSMREWRAVLLAWCLKSRRS